MSSSRPAQFQPNKIIIHHSLTKDSGTVSWGAIRHYHTVTKKWSDIGYHVGIECVSSGAYSYIEAIMGRMWNTPGAHTEGHNHNSLGICFIGNFDLEAPEERLLLIGARVVALWMRLFKIPSYMIYPHRAFNEAKSCPGKFFDVEEFVGMIIRESLGGE